MKTTKFFLSAFAAAIFFTAALSSGIFANDETSLNCYDNTMYQSTTDSTGTGTGDGTGGDSNPGGGSIFPVGH